MKLFLSSNSLLKVPGAVFDLQHLTNLSLRGCGLRELPPAIGRLHLLETLNLAQNALRYLPAELLGLLAAPGSLRSLLLQGNSFYHASQLPEQVVITSETATGEKNRGGLREGQIVNLRNSSDLSRYETDLASVLPRLYEGRAARYFARSPVQYSDSWGSFESGFRLDGLPASEETLPIDEIPVMGSSASDDQFSAPASSSLRSRDQPLRSQIRGSRVPSLVELAARSCYWSADLEDLPIYVPESLSRIHSLLDGALEQREAGGFECWKCKKTMVTPTVKWLEWWQVVGVEQSDNPSERGNGQPNFTPPWSNEEQAVPFLRMGCSRGCGPEKIQAGAWALRDDTQVEE